MRTVETIRQTIRQLDMDPGTYYAATVTTAAGRVVEDTDTGEALAAWVREFRRAEKLARVDIRELADDECSGIWASPGTSPE
jgi:hypothetical protein